MEFAVDFGGFRACFRESTSYGFQHTMSELTREQIEELIERSKNDRAIIVGSEVRQLANMALRSPAPLSATERKLEPIVRALDAAENMRHGGFKDGLVAAYDGWAREAREAMRSLAAAPAPAFATAATSERLGQIAHFLEQNGSFSNANFIRTLAAAAPAPAQGEPASTTCPNCYGDGPHAECPLCKGSGYVTAPTAPVVEVAAIRDAALEEAAKEIEPGYPRGCDCERCDCGNSGDSMRVAAWDSDTASAAMIRKLKGRDMKPSEGGK